MPLYLKLLKPNFNVRDYGAKGDGTTDDTATLQAAENAAFAAGGGTVYWPAGSYLCGGLVRHSIVEWLGDGDGVSIILANANSINMVTCRGSAFGGGSVPEIEYSRAVFGITFDGNGHTGVIGIGNMGIAYYEIARNRFRSLSVGIDNYGSLQWDIHHNIFQDCTKDIYSHAESLSYRGITPPNRVKASFNAHYGATSWAHDHSGGAQLILRDEEYGSCGTIGDVNTGAVWFHDDDLNAEYAQGIDSQGGWAEGTEGFGVFKIGPSTGGHVHSIRDLNVPTNEAAHVIGVDGSHGAQIVVCDGVTVADSATNRDFYRAGANITWRILRSRGALTGSGGVVIQDPLLNGSLVYPPGYEFDYKELTGNVAITNLSEATATTILAGNSVTYDGTTIVMIEFYAPIISLVNGDNTRFALYDGASSIGEIARFTEYPASSSGITVTGLFKRRLTPSAAAHTYSIRGWDGTGSGGATGDVGGSGALVPAFIRITKV